MCSNMMLEAGLPGSPRPSLPGGIALEVESASTPSRILQTIKEFRESRQVVDALKQQHWHVLLFGQAIAIAAASVNASSFTLEYNLGVVLPIFQMTIMYMFLSSYLCCRKDVQQVVHNKLVNRTSMETDVGASPHPASSFYTLPLLKIKLRIPWWIYFLVSLLDVEANYMVLLSLRFTSLTSSTLLGSLTVPSVMFCSRYILARVFSPLHYIGVCLCLLGGTIMVWSDLGGDKHASEEELHADTFVGDLLAVAAALLYGLGDTVAEYAIKHIDRAEYLGMLGLFGFLIGSIQFLFVEWQSLMNLIWYTPPTRQRQVVATMVWYIASLFFYYVAASYFLTRSDATLLNLSLQTTSLWACLFSVLADGTIPPLLFFLAVALVSFGVCIYEFGGTSQSKLEEEEDTAGSDEESEKLTVGDSSRNDQDYLSVRIIS